MSFLKRKDPYAIPPVSAPVTSPTNSSNKLSKSPPPSTYRSNASTYNVSRDGDPYNPPSSFASSNTTLQPEAAGEFDLRDKYSRNRNIGDAYSRGNGANLDSDRNELFAGYNPNDVRSGRFLDGPQAGPEPTPGEENDEDVEAIKTQTRFVKQESVNSTRNALRMAREAEETARNTVLRLGDQSDKLANTERHLDVAKGHTSRAEDNANELKQLNRSIFRPVVVWNKNAKRAAEEAKVHARYEEERYEREKTMIDIRESQNRLGRAATYGRGDGDGDDEEGLTGNSVRNKYRTAERLEQRKRYQFEATASDDEMEDELDKNMDELNDVTKRLKALGMAMGQELDAQNKRIESIEGKASRTEERLALNTQRLKKIK